MEAKEERANLVLTSVYIISRIGSPDAKLEETSGDLSGAESSSIIDRFSCGQSRSFSLYLLFVPKDYGQYLYQIVTFENS